MERSDAIAYCREQVRSYDLDRYLSALFVPEADRRHLFALYAFNLEIAKTREIVSEPMLGRIRLQWWREAVAEIYEGAPRRHEVVAALAAAVAERRLPREPLERMIDGRDRELDDPVFDNRTALEEHCEATSSALAALAVQVLGGDGPPSREAARHGGIAWALTGLLRSLPYHLGQRRHFLPRRSLAEAGLDEGDLFRRPPPAALGRVVAEMAGTAREHLAAARRHRSAMPRNARRALLHLTLADVSLRRIEAAGFDPFAPRIELAPPLRQLRLLRAAIAGRY